MRSWSRHSFRGNYWWIWKGSDWWPDWCKTGLFSNCDSRLLLSLIIDSSRCHLRVYAFPSKATARDNRWLVKSYQVVISYVCMLNWRPTGHRVDFGGFQVLALFCSPDSRVRVIGSLYMSWLAFALEGKDGTTME